jgi:ABC-type multidrug transport system fused ATPase/permease subunit
MRAVDPRLLQHARAAMSYLVVTVLLGLVVTGLILAQAVLLAHALAAALGTGARALAGALALLLGGSALLNGHDLASYAADDVRSVIGGCPQDPHLFDAPIRDNLRLARPGATDELDQVDQIVVLDHGRVAEHGSHHGLRHAGGPYQRIWENGYGHH